MHSDTARKAPLFLKIMTGLVILFLHFPAAIIVLYAFTNEENRVTFPPPGLTFDWFFKAIDTPAIWNALGLSLSVAIISMVVATALGLLAAGAVHRMTWASKDVIAFILVLPIALPGIVTGVALSSSMNIMQIDKGFWTIVAGHVTFCIVTVYNNVIARFRRMGNSQVEASMDLGASALETFRYVIFPGIATALLAGALLAFALSMDEIIVTKFTSGSGQTTLPIWIFDGLANRPRNRPLTNVVAIFVLASTFIPVILAQRWTQRTSSEQ